MHDSYDFSGWATRNDLLCADGRTIRRDAFKHCDGKTVPLVWNHQHNDQRNVLGHALLENREEGVYVYGTFNDTEAGKNARLFVQHGDVNALSIYANRLKQAGGDVLHGNIREVSLVLAGANPGAYIDSIMAHGEYSDEEAFIYTPDEYTISLAHSDEEAEETVVNEDVEEADEVTTEKEAEEMEETQINEEVENEISHSDKEESEVMADNKEKTVQDVIDSMTEEQQNVMYGLIGQALEDNAEGGEMKHNLFDQETDTQTYLSHADEEQIIALAKSNGVGSLQDALEIFAENNDTLAHSIENIEQMFPDYKNLDNGEPETITRDLTWVDAVIAGAHKSPISRIRTRQLDARQTGIRAKGYKKGEKKTNIGDVKLLKRTTDPQTVYVKDQLNRDDIIDITDFDVVNYQYKIMKQALNEEIALAVMVGDGREDTDPDKISEDHIRSIWHDDELYTIHQDVDIAKAKSELQGTNTGANFGDNYVYAEAIIAAALYSREQYKGSGSLKFYCTPHLLNVMLLARDMNGRRIYESKADLAAALDVVAIETAEQFEGLIREDKQNKKHKLLGIFVNMTDYQIGSTKGGEITRFNQFDIDFNREKYLIETRISGALTRVYSAIALEEPVAVEQQPAG